MPKTVQNFENSEIREKYGVRKQTPGTAYLPKISIPVVKIRNSPLNLSFAASHHQDEFLLAAT